MRRWCERELRILRSNSSRPVPIIIEKLAKADFVRTYGAVRGRMNYGLHENTFVDWTSRMLQTQLIAEINRGATASQVSERLGLPSSVSYAVRKYLGENAYEKLVANGRTRQALVARKASAGTLKSIAKLSKAGHGIEYIGAVVGLHSTTVRYNLIQQLGLEKYQSVHNAERYKGGPKYSIYTPVSTGDRIQSRGELRVARWLKKRGIRYKMHTTIRMGRRVRYPDFYLLELGVYIEVAGLSDMEFYKVSMAKKKRLYHDLRLSVLWLYRRDVVGRHVPIKLQQFVKVQYAERTTNSRGV